MDGRPARAGAPPARRCRRCASRWWYCVHVQRHVAFLLLPPRSQQRAHGRLRVALASRRRIESAAPMTPLAYTIAASLAGGVLAVVAAAATLALHASWIPRLVSFAVGALLGAVFLELLPHALEAGSSERVMTTVLAGLLGFFLLEIH